MKFKWNNKAAFGSFQRVLKGWTNNVQYNKKLKSGEKRARLIFVAEKDDAIIKNLTQGLSGGDQNQLKLNRAVFQSATDEGALIILRPYLNQASVLFNPKSHNGHFETTAYAQARDLIGPQFKWLREQDYKKIEVELFHCSEEAVAGALVGIELACYRFIDVIKNNDKQVEIVMQTHGVNINVDAVKAARECGIATNLARHLVNLPAAQINPSTLSQYCKSLFTQSKNSKVEVWGAARLLKENMNLHHAVGKGAEFEPCLVKISYRPKGQQKARPFAFVGKGITFDTGGLDIKSASSMRNMKKDMGGAASLLGLAYWLDRMRLPMACDFYLALAENAVSDRSFHPGDVIQSRAGLLVEIHNTDAEGRLVLADSLDLAAQSKPRCIIDVATLTGAMRTSLGADIGGFFSNNDDLADKIINASHSSGDYLWRMPLVQSYRKMMTSRFADMTNSVDGFAGAITAALFLESFVGPTPWAHLDVYTWKDSPEGAIAEQGGSGQAVQCLIKYLSEAIL